MSRQRKKNIGKGNKHNRALKVGNFLKDHGMIDVCPLTLTARNELRKLQRVKFAMIARDEVKADYSKEAVLRAQKNYEAEQARRRLYFTRMDGIFTRRKLSKERQKKYLTEKGES